MPVLGHALAAVATHLWFKSYDPTSPQSIFSMLIFPPLTVYLLLSNQSTGLLRDCAVFYATLVASVVLYRLSPLHPLAKYPGPLLCRITKFRMAWVAAQGRNHKFYQALHKKYGSIVRVGPNELSIVDVNIMPFILGSQGMPKGPIWDGRRFGLMPDCAYDSLIDVRDLGIHAQLRKPWNEAFSSGPVKEYHQLLHKRGEELSTQLYKIATSTGASGDVPSVNLVKWINYFAFDFMGDLAFGASFNLMSEGDVDGAWKRMEDGLALPAIAGQIPWLMPMLNTLPFVTAKKDEFKDFGRHHALKRIAMNKTTNDLFYYLYDEPAVRSGVPLKERMNLVISNSLLTIVAGSDTTSTVLSCIMCCLLARKDVVARLRDELDAVFTTINDSGVPDIEIDKLLKLPYLSAVVNEGLRLAPAVPSNMQRAPEKGSGGRILGDSKIFIPEGTSVNVPAYVYHHDPRYFSPSPETFIPERWISSSAASPNRTLSTSTNHSRSTSPSSVIDDSAKSHVETKYTTSREAFIPFSYGPGNCAGKPLAMLELRFVIAILVQRFDLCYKGCRNASREVLAGKEKAWLAGLKDAFVFTKLPLEVEITPREDLWKA
ncbi:cytochrome P450 [Coprinopsis cinerea AmutBmut pab1-1]|nr:cytochrome P450 [Coprinopsis cinerea AmutBmut pab1-1]